MAVLKNGVRQGERGLYCGKGQSPLQRAATERALKKSELSCSGFERAFSSKL